jgi:glycosyltransferase involved in cell wall biosynthesis
MSFFSIILPTYNRAHFLPKAIESVLAQTYEDWELIIVDDGSTDNTKEVITKYEDLRIRYFFQENQERSAARNNGIEQAQGEYVCFLDSDDYYLTEKLTNLKKGIEKLQDKKQVILYDGLFFEIKNEQRSVPLPPKSLNETVHEFLLLNPLFSQQICAHKEVFRQHQYNSELRIGEDVELWLRMACDVLFLPVDSYQTVILEHEDRSVNLKKHNAAKEQLKQLDLIFNMYSNEQISDKVRKKMRSDCYFNSAKHFMMNGRKWKAISEIVKSASTDFQNSQFKHRMYCLFKLLLGEIPLEYKN